MNPVFDISREQQKVFIKHFVDQALAVALQMTAEGRDKGSPGETLMAVGQALIAQLHQQASQAKVDA